MLMAVICWYNQQKRTNRSLYIVINSRLLTMFNPEQIKNLADQWMRNLPGQGLTEEMKMMAKAHFQQWLVQANLVTREEFDVQAELLNRTQERLATLEQQLSELQQSLEDDA
jgi:hypothetical protein